VNPAGGCHNEPVQILQAGAAVPDPLALYARAAAAADIDSAAR
jgi:hypothetical protein